MKVQKLIVHTDVMVEYLGHRGEQKSLLRRVMQEYFCYTTVFTAIDLFSLARTARQEAMVVQALSAMKILGLNAKNAPRYGLLLATPGRRSLMDLFIAGVCLETKLPLLVIRKGKFASIAGLKLLTASAFAANKRNTDSHKTHLGS